MSRSINQIQYVFLTLVHIFHLDSMALNRYATFTFQIHVVKHLALRHLNGLGIFQQTVGQG